MGGRATGGGADVLDTSDPVWGADDDGSARFPARFKVSPILVRDVEVGIPIEETIGVLDCLDSKHWSGLFRRSLTPIPATDGETLLRLPEGEREPSPVRIPRKRISRPRVAPDVSAAEEPGATGTSETDSQPRLHLES